jgi:hypothetical protein
MVEGVKDGQPGDGTYSVLLMELSSESRGVQEVPGTSAGPPNGLVRIALLACDAAVPEY